MTSVSKVNYNPEEKLLDTLNDLAIGFVKISNDGNILTHNLTFNKVFGYNLEVNLVGTNILDYWLNLEEWNKFREILYKNGIVKKYVAPVKKVDGEKIFLELNFKLNKNSNREIISSEGAFVDVTERKKAEEALKASERMLQKSQEIGQIGSFEMDLATNEITWSDQLYKLFGLKREGRTIEYEKVLELIHPDDRERAIKVSSDAAKEHKPYTLEHRVIHHDGEIFDLLITGDVIRNEKNEIVKIGGTTQDITEYKKAEQRLRVSENKLRKLNNELEQIIEERTRELKESEERWRSITQYTPDNIMQLDLEGNILYINHTVPDLSIDEVIGKSIYQFVPEKYRENIKNTFASILSTGESGKYETGYRDSMGNNLIFEAHVGPILDSGQIVGFIARSTDITVRKKAEDKVIWKTNIMKAINDVFKKALTCETEEELGKTCLDVAQELSGAKFGFFGEVNSEGKFDTLAISNPGWDECAMPGSTAIRLIKGMEIRGIQFLPLRDGTSHIFNDPSNHPDSVEIPEGHPIITSLLAVPFLSKSEIIGQIGLGNKKGGFDQDDLKAIESLSVAMIETLLRKRAEENLRKSEEKYRNAYKLAEFYKDLFAHDIKNILNGINGATGLYFLYEEDNTKVKEKHTLVNIIKDQVTKGTLLISNVRKLSQLDENKDKLLRKINLLEIMNQAKIYTKESFQDREIDIIENYSIQKPKVFANELLLDIFENLLINAVKYNDSPIVKIQIKISRKTENGKKFIKVEFIDNGIGVMNKNKKIIFKRGYQKEKGTKGMGFGLTLVKTLMKIYEGKIWVEDIVEGDYTQGSNFILLIPESI